MKLKNHQFILFFGFLGAISILVQTVFLRELTVLFYGGNELFYGLGLGSWLFFTGMGSLIALKLKFLKSSAKTLWLWIAGLAVLLPLIIIFLRWLISRTVPTGELPPFGLAILVLEATLFIFCLPLGALFPLGVLAFKKQEMKKVTNSAYLLETLGFALAGCLFSFFLAETCFPFPSKQNNLTLAFRYPKLITAINSKYNQIIVTEEGKQLNFFLSGQFAYNTQENLENQKTLALIKPFLNDSKTILALTDPGLANNIKDEFLPEKIDWLQIDDKLLELEKNFLAKEVNPLIADPRKFLSRTQQKWDLIFYFPGNPQTLLTNRYFTLESFVQVKNHLNEKGVFVLSFYIPTDYQSREALRFGRSIYQTFQNVFLQTELLIKEDQIILLGGENLKLNQSKIKPKWRDYFWFQIGNLQKEEILKKLKMTPEKLNTDFEPIAFFYQQLFWQTIFSFQIPRFFLQGAKIIPFFLLFLYFLLLQRARGKSKLGFLMAGLSFVLISLETIIIFLFQTKIGHLYSQIAIIFSLFLLGMAVGVKMTESIQNFVSALRKTLVVFLITFMGVVWLSTPLSEWQNFWFFATLVSGVFGGAIFAQINSLYLSQNRHPGFIYASDLFGGCLGAVLTSSILIPVIGTRILIIVLASIILISLISTIAKPRE